MSNYFDEQIKNLISDTFEYVISVEKIAKYYKQHDRGAESIYAIKEICFVHVKV